MTGEPLCPASRTSAELSPAGIARRAAMLVELDDAMRRRNVQRQTLRVAAVSTPVLVIGAMVTFWTFQRSTPDVAEALAKTSTAPLIVQMIQTDPFITERLNVSGRALTVTEIDDAGLQEMLRSMGQPAGLVRAGGRTVLASEVRVPASVPDLEPGSLDGDSSS